MDSQHRYSRLGMAAIAALCLWAAVAAAPAAAGTIPHLQWTNVYGPTTNQDMWNDVAVGPGHSVYVCGTQNLGQGLAWLMTVAKYGANQKPLWQTILNPAVETWSDGGASSQGRALAVDHAGNVIVVGSSGASAGGFAVVKFASSDGHIIWQKDFRLAGDASARDVVLDSAGNAYVTGRATTGPATGVAMYAAKFRAADGKRLWQNLYSGPLLTSEGDAIAIDASRDTYVIGSTLGSGSSNQWVTRKVSAAGKSLWTHRWSGALKLGDVPSTVTVSTSAVYVAGSTQTDVAGSHDAVLVKYDLAGHRRWAKQFKHPGTDAVVYGACLDSSGRLLFCGLRHSNVPGPDKTFLAKVTPAGKTVWLRSDPSPSNPLGAMGYYAIVRGPSGSMYLSGFEAPSATDTDILIEKRTATGKVAWQADFGWPDGGDDNGGALALDGTAGLYVTGEIWTTNNFIDATLQKYKP